MIKKLLLSTLVIISLVACSETDTIDTTVEENEETSENNAEGNTVGNQGNEEENQGSAEENEANGEESIQEEASIVIVEENGIKITYTGLEIGTDAIFGKEAKIKFEIENNTENLITVQQRNLSIDGYMVDGAMLTFSEDVSAGKKAKGSISIMELDGYDFPEFNEDMEFDIVVIDGDSWDHILEKPVSITIENGGTATDGNEDSGEENEDTNSLVLVDEAGIKITYTGLVINEDEIFGTEANIKFSIENNTDKFITVQQRNLSVDGYMVDDAILSFSQDVTAGKKANGSISIMEFEGYDFPEFNEDMEFDIVVIDGDSWDHIIEKPVKIVIE